MVDTFRPLELCEPALACEDTSYAWTWSGRSVRAMPPGKRIPTGTGMATASTRPLADAAVARRARRVVLRLAPVVAVLACVSCRGRCLESRVARPEALAAEIVQLRSDVPLNRVQIGLVNSGEETVVVDSLHVRIPGFRSPESGCRRTLPWRPGCRSTCPGPTALSSCPVTDAAPDVGPPVVTLRVHTESDPTSRTLRLTATDPTKVLQRIADRTCAVERVNREVALEFGDTWRPERRARRSPGPARHAAGAAAHRRAAGGHRGAGAIMYALSRTSLRDPFRLRWPSCRRSGGRSRSRSSPMPPAATGTRIGEIKKPYEFLVWVARPGEEPVAVTPAIGQPTKDALRLVCAF